MPSVDDLRDPETPAATGSVREPRFDGRPRVRDVKPHKLGKDGFGDCPSVGPRGDHG